MTDRRIALLVASPRPESLNLKLGKAIAKLSPEGYGFERVEMGDLPFYDQALEGDRRPACGASPTRSRRRTRSAS